MVKKKIIKKGQCRDVNADKLKLINAILSAKVTLKEHLVNAKTVYFSISSYSPPKIEYFERVTGFKLEDG